MRAFILYDTRLLIHGYYLALTEEVGEAHSKSKYRPSPGTTLGAKGWGSHMSNHVNFNHPSQMILRWLMTQKNRWSWGCCFCCGAFISQVADTVVLNYTNYRSSWIMQHPRQHPTCPTRRSVVICWTSPKKGMPRKLLSGANTWSKRFYVHHSMRFSSHTG